MGFDLHASGTTDPKEVRNFRIHIIAIIASMSAIAMGYDTSVIGGTLALDSFRRDYGLLDISSKERDTLQGNIVSTFQAGCFFGALGTFPIAEKIGRKKAMMYASLVFLVGGTLMTAAHGKIAMIIAGRAVAGLGIGAVSLIVPVYIAETAPPSIRGRLIGIFEIASQGGGMCGFWINYAVDRTIPDSSQTQWIVPLGLQLLPGAILFFGVFFICPESPRWLARKDRWEDALKILVDIRKLPSDHEYIQTELADIRMTVEERSANRMTKSAMFKRLFEKGTRNRIAIGLLLMCCQNMTGVNIITYYSPRIFETLGVTGTDTKLFATGFYGIAKTLGMIFFSLYLVEKVGRRNGLIYGAFIGSLPMWYIGGYVFKADPAAAAAAGELHRTGAGYLAMIRMLCVAITTADQWLWSFIISRTTPYMITSLGYGTYMFFGSLMLLMGFWAFFFIPETKGLTLEDMDNLFSGSMHKAVWKSIKTKQSVHDVLQERRLEQMAGAKGIELEDENGMSARQVDEKHVGLSHVEAVGVESRDDPGQFPKNTRVLSC